MLSLHFREYQILQTMANASRMKPSCMGRSSSEKVSGGFGSGFAGWSEPSMFMGASIFCLPVSSLRVFLFAIGCAKGAWENFKICAEKICY